MSNLKVVDIDTDSIVDGFSIFSNAQIETKQKILEKKYTQKHLLDINGNFFFYFFNNCKTVGLNNATIARLIMTATYCNYDNRLQYDNGRPIDLDGLKRILKLSDKTFFYFIKEADKAGILKQDELGFLMNRDVLYKGRLKTQCYSESFVKIYDKSVREIYNKVSNKSHKTLGYLFVILPYINIDYNMLCNNVNEKDIEKIEPLTLNEVAKMFNVSKGCMYNIRDCLSKIQMKNNEKCISFVWNDDISKYRIAVNPDVYYRGNNIEARRTIKAIFF